MTKQGGVDMSDVDEEIGLTESEIERGEGGELLGSMLFRNGSPSCRSRSRLVRLR